MEKIYTKDGKDSYKRRKRYMYKSITFQIILDRLLSESLEGQQLGTSSPASWPGPAVTQARAPGRP